MPSISLRLALRFSRIAALFALTATFASGVHAQALQGNQLSQSQLELLQQLSPQEREQVLRTVVESGDVNQEERLRFPQLVRPLDEGGTDTGTGELDGPPQLFDVFGRPVLDSERRPVFLTPELLNELETQSPEDWLSSETPFFEQDIKLRPFGYDLFAGVPTTFAPATDVPVPPEYRLGPGDTIDVQLFGKENRQYSLVVRRDGTINFPNIGPVTVIGDSFQEMKQQVLDRVAEQLIGTSAAINMGALRSIQVLVLGDARQPGSYTVSGLSNITNALFVSGGINKIGSLRNIQLKRQGEVIATLDLYDLLLNGDSTDDVRLESGDVIFIPTVGTTVGVGGFVKRPAIYELKNERTAQQVLQLAGGFRPDAYPQISRVERFDEQQQRSFINLDLLSPKDQAFRLAAGDTLLVPPVLAEFRGGVQLIGRVQRPGVYEWQPGMRLTDLLPSLERLLPQADTGYVLVRREQDDDKRIATLSANLGDALTNPQSEANIELQPRDTVWVFGLDDERVELIRPLLDELRLQAEPGRPFHRVAINGLVRAPGNYPFESGMRVSELVRAGGGLAESAYALEVDLTRFSVVDSTSRSSKVRELNIEKALAGDPEHNILLEPQDRVSVRRLENWDNDLVVTLRGEVRFPGTYSFTQGDTLTDVLERAGGLTEQAFPAGALFLRQELREREQQQLERLRDRLSGDLTQLSLQAAGEVQDSVSVMEAQSAGRALLADLNNTEAVGRLVIDLPRILANRDDASSQILLKDRDELLIPGRTQEVTIIGEVYFPTSHLYESGVSRDAYLKKSGGITPAGSKGNIYVVKANGAVMAKGSRFFSSSQRIDPGDTIVVPLDTQKGFRLRTIASATSVVYNLAIAVAAINGLSN